MRLAQQRRAVFGGGRGVGADSQRDGVAAEAASGAGGEQRIVGSPGSFGQPGPEQRIDWAGEGDGALFASFAFAADVGADAEGDVARSSGR